MNGRGPRNRYGGWNSSSRSSSSRRCGLEPAVITRPSGRSRATEWYRRGTVALAEVEGRRCDHGGDRRRGQVEPPRSQAAAPAEVAARIKEGPVAQQEQVGVEGPPPSGLLAGPPCKGRIDLVAVRAAGDGQD